MSVHKFGGFRRPSSFPPPPPDVTWCPDWEAKHPPIQAHRYKWKLFCQQDLTILPDTSCFIHTKFGVKVTLGTLLISLANSIKLKKLNIQNESVAENTNDVFFILRNNSDEAVTINEGDELCYFTYINIQGIK